MLSAFVWTYLWKGIVVGLSVAAPIGPLGILCIRRTLHFGLLYGLVTGLAVSFADALYGAVAGFGLGAVSDVLLSHRAPIAVAGGLFLAWIGLKVLLAGDPSETDAETGGGLGACFGSAFLLTVASPVTILYFAAVFAHMGALDVSGNNVSAWGLVAGVFLGSALWWLFLSASVRVLRGQLNVQGLLWVNRLSGICLIAFGAITLVSVAA